MLNFKKKSLTITVLLLAHMQVGYAADVIKGQSVTHRQFSSFSALSNDQIKSLQKDGLQKQNELRKISTNLDRKGNQHTRYRQYYHGIPVFGKQLIEHTNAKSGKSRFTGKIVEQIQSDLPSNKLVLTVNKEDALNKAKSLFIDSRADAASLVFSNESSELVIVLDDNNIARQAFHVTYGVDSTDGGDPAKPSYLLDANTLSVIQYWNDLQTLEIGTGPGGNVKTGIYQYGLNSSFLDVTPDAAGVTCAMINNKVKTINLNHGTSGTDAYAYTCPENLFQQINGAYSPLNDVHYFGGVIYDMYNDWYGMDPLSLKLEMRVHYGTNLQNAFFNSSTMAMTFGDGGEKLYPLVSLDIVAHEVGHGVTFENSRLKYSNQSGGMNEAFSDMMGEAAEYYERNSSDWLTGGEVFKGTGAMRYFEDPTLNGRSIGHASDYYDGIDVHLSSGIYNRAFYLLATSPGWDIKKAFDLMLHANMNYWEPLSTFAEGVCGVESAATDLGYDPAAVDNAFLQVGLECGVVLEQQAPIVSSFVDGVASIVGVVGENLWNISSVTFGGTHTSTYQFMSPEELLVIKPNQFTTGPICVTTPGGTGCSIEKYYGRPVVDSYTKSFGSLVVLSGNNLTGVTSVTFNGLQVPGYQEQGYKQLVVLTPTGVTSGPICVTTIGGSFCTPFDYVVVP